MLGRLWRAITRRDETTDFLTASISDPNGAHVVVTLDGMLVPFAVEADTVEGWVDVHRTDKLGRVICALGWPIKDRHYGRVRILFKDDRARDDWHDSP